MFAAIILEAQAPTAADALPPRVKPVEGRDMALPFLAHMHWRLLVHTLAYAVQGHRFGSPLTIFLVDSINQGDFVAWMNAFDGQVFAKFGPFEGMPAFNRFMDELGKRLDKASCFDEIDGKIACKDVIERWRC